MQCRNLELSAKKTCALYRSSGEKREWRKTSFLSSRNMPRYLQPQLGTNDNCSQVILMSVFVVFVLSQVNHGHVPPACLKLTTPVRTFFLFLRSLYVYLVWHVFNAHYRHLLDWNASSSQDISKVHLLRFSVYFLRQESSPWKGTVLQPSTRSVDKNTSQSSAQKKTLYTSQPLVLLICPHSFFPSGTECLTHIYRKKNQTRFESFL